MAWPPKSIRIWLFCGVPVNRVENVGSQAAQPHLKAAGSEDELRFDRGTGPQPRRGRTARMNGLGRLRVSASSREEQQRTKPQGTRGGVLGVNGEGPLKGTHIPPYFIS